MIEEKKFYEEENHMIDARRIYNYIKMEINPYGKPFEGTVFEFGQKIMETIVNMNKQPKVGDWISCSEKMPEDGKDVLVWFEYFRYGDYNRLYQTMGISYTWDGAWSGFVNGESGWRKLRIIAWQPLPEPYKGDVE